MKLPSVKDLDEWDISKLTSVASSEESIFFINILLDFQCLN